MHQVILQSSHINYTSGAKKNIILLELQGSAKYGGLASRLRNFIIVIGTWELWNVCLRPIVRLIVRLSVRLRLRRVHEYTRFLILFSFSK